jgi:hypothetical protein
MAPHGATTTTTTNGDVKRSIDPEGKKAKKAKKDQKKKSLFHLAASRPQEISFFCFFNEPIECDKQDS